MRFSILVSASATFLLAAAAPLEDVSLDEALKNFDYGEMMDLGRDGVLRSLNAAHDTVLDFVQLSGPQITEFFAKTGSDPSVMSGVDGRTVTSDAQLWAVPDDIVAREPTVRTSEAKLPGVLSVHQRAECVAGAPCDETADCYEYNCARCLRGPMCIGGPSGCLNQSGKCAWNR